MPPIILASIDLLPCQNVSQSFPYEVIYPECICPGCCVMIVLFLSDMTNTDMIIKSNAVITGYL